MEDNEFFDWLDSNSMFTEKVTKQQLLDKYGEYLTQEQKVEIVRELVEESLNNREYYIKYSENDIEKVTKEEYEKEGFKRMLITDRLIEHVEKDKTTLV